MSKRLSPTQPMWLVLVALAATLCCAAFTAGNARAGNPVDPAVFDVGAASANINPDTPQYPGGYGYKVDPFTTTNDDLEVRAFVVGKGENAAVFVSADLVGWFAAYNGANLEPYGIDRTRERIATALNAQGYNIDRKSVIISSTHTHAAPSVVGIWGTPDAAYLKKVGDGAVQAAADAATAAKPSEIWSGVGNIRSFVWQNGQGTNHPDGFAVDEELPIMWARDPETGATNALYANVPNHPDQFNGKDNMAFSADWPGYTRRALDKLNGGTSVVAAGTLGRQEPPGSIKTYDEVEAQGEYVVNQIQRTMANATPLTSDTIAGTEAYMQTPADNNELILGMDLYAPPEGVCIDLYSICTIPRSIEPPYLVDGTPDKLIGTYIPSVRIGDLMYTSNPGEAFPEVNDAIRNSVTNDRHTTVVGMSNDMLGYYYERADYTDEQFGSSDFEKYNVGPDMPQDNADLATANATTLGFSTIPTPTVHEPFDSTVADKVGLQWYSNHVESSDPEVNIYAGAQKSQDETVNAPATIDWDFGDSTTDTTDNGVRFKHTFPGPGTYEVTATVTGSNTKVRTWTDSITIDPPLTAAATVQSRTRDGAVVNVTTAGGSGKLVGAVWTCQDGEKVNGATATCSSLEAGNATVTAADGAGNTATATVAIEAAPPEPVVTAAKLKIVKIKPKAKKVKKGKSAKFAVVIKNTGDATASKVKVCSKVPKKARKGVKAKPACKKPGSIKAGKKKTVKIKLKLTRKAPKKTKVKIEVTASEVKKAKGKVTVKAKAGKRKKNRK
ncbi:MAG: PKD domain-containing protein [Solirubrobacterales bacterium]|nr:PKD domain-containing protein [Solirubrobacterales bacterium]